MANSAKKLSKETSQPNSATNAKISGDPLLHLLHLVSPALPVGAYAYSQGLETAVELEWVHDFDSAQDWIGHVMSEGLACLDLPVLIRVAKAWRGKDFSSVQYWNNFLLVSRESKELLLEDTQMGEALFRLLVDLDIEDVKAWQQTEKTKSSATTNFYDAKPSFITQFALAATAWNIDEENMLKGFVWSWLENQVAAAIKLVPLGQTEAQKLLIALMPNIEISITKARSIETENMGSNLPRLTLGSMQHETQYSRLFRS